MSTQIKLRRGTTTQHNSFTGVEGELTVDTDKKVAVVHDGSTVGGTPLAKEVHNHNSSYLQITNNLSDLNSSSTARTNLGLGALATLATVGTSQIDDNSITGAKIAMGSDAAGDLLYYNGTDYARLAAGTASQVLKSGTTPAWSSVNGAMIRMGSDAQGDILYFNGTDYVRLGAGTSGHFLKTQGTGANPIWAAASGGGGLTLGTPVSFASSDITFTGIPSGTKMIIVNSYGSFGVAPTIQLGDSGGIETSGYQGRAVYWNPSADYIDQVGISASFDSVLSGTGAVTAYLTLMDSSTNTWNCTLNSSISDGTYYSSICFGSKSLSAELDRVKITGITGSSGKVNIAYM